MQLSNGWIQENFRLGSINDTNVGDTVHIVGYDGFDEVLFPHKVLEVNLENKSIKTVEKNNPDHIPLTQHGSWERTRWYLEL